MDTKGNPNSDDIKEMNWIKDGRHLGSEGMWVVKQINWFHSSSRCIPRKNAHSGETFREVGA